MKIKLFPKNGGYTKAVWFTEKWMNELNDWTNGMINDEYMLPIAYQEMAMDGLIDWLN